MILESLAAVIALVRVPGGPIIKILTCVILGLFFLHAPAYVHVLIVQVVDGLLGIATLLTIAVFVICMSAIMC